MAKLLALRTRLFFSATPSRRAAAWGAFALPAVLLVAAGCNAGPSQADYDALKTAQQETVARLEKMERLQGRSPQAQPPRPPPGPDASKIYAMPVGQAPVRGSADAWVTIVEVSDFQCPFCGRAAATLREVEKAYGKDVRIAFKHNPLGFHDRALPAAMATACAQAQDKFWPVADALFAAQAKLGDSDLENVAKEAGCNMAHFKKCMADAAPKAGIEADQAQAAKFGARGTPAFFINGRFLSGAQPLPAFKALIDEELKKAKASGVAKANYYAQEVEAKGASSL